MNLECKKARVIAFYLPQFHPIPENDNWWGKGFTEWTNVAKAKPLFHGHIHPRVPADLGFYDLRMPEIREAQANLAKESGVEGFCYWHYWFGNGKQLLERPFNEVLDSGKPDFPFCLGWANHDWTNKTWKIKGKFTKEVVLQKQTYPGEDDIIEHFYSLLKAFFDKRYLRVNNKPIFLVFNPLEIPDVNFFIDKWNNLAIKNGLEGIHFVGISDNNPSIKRDRVNYSLLATSTIASQRYKEILDLGFNAVNSRGMSRAQLLTNGIFKSYLIEMANRTFNGIIVNKYRYKYIIKHLYVEEDKWENVYPTIIPNYDRSPRSGKKAVIWYGSTPELFDKNIKSALDLIENKPYEKKIIFLKSWNEWAETNYVEPDIYFGRSYLNSLKGRVLE